MSDDDEMPDFKKKRLQNTHNNKNKISPNSSPYLKGLFLSVLKR